MKNIFIFGYYGFQNTGDEAILEVIIKQIKKHIPYANITALSYKAQETIDRHNINVVSRNRFINLIKAIKESDIVISGGGSILQDSTSARSLIYYLSIIYLAKSMGKKVMFYGNGFGPITKSINKKLAKHIINKVDIITVRDKESKKEMRSLGITKDITITADVTFAYDELPVTFGDDILINENIDKNKQIIGISVREWKNEKDYKYIIGKICDYLIDKGYEVVFIPMQHPKDYVTSEEIVSIMEKEPKILYGIYSPQEIIGFMENLHLMIGMRLHSLIFSTIAKTPIIGVEYDTKIPNFLKIVDQENAGNIKDLNLEQFIKTIDYVLDNYEEYKKKIDLTGKILKRKSENNIEILKSFMGKGEC